jgi:hypothetical protein
MRGSRPWVDCQEETFAEAARALRQKACTGAIQALRLLEQGYPAAARLLARLAGFGTQ